MEEFLTKLYSYEYFSTYLIIAIVILIILFIVILFFGKKDQKKREIEATKKLMQINADPTNDQFVLEEKQNSESEKLENDTIIVPNINELNISESVENNINMVVPEPILPDNSNNEVVSESNFVENVASTINPEPAFSELHDNAAMANELPIIDETPINIKEQNTFKIEETETPVEVNNSFNIVKEPILPSYEEKPFIFDDSNNNDSIIAPNFDQNKVEEPASEEISVPDFNFDEIVKNTEEIKKEEKIEVPKPTEVFSSVYAPEKRKIVDYNNDFEEDEFELPTLKKDYEEPRKQLDVPELNDYNLDSISGESYDIK